MHPKLPEVQPVSHFMGEADRVFILTFYLHPVLRLMLHATLLPNLYEFSLLCLVENIVLYYRNVLLYFMLK